MDVNLSRRDIDITVALNKRDKKEFSEIAAARGMPLATFIRFAARCAVTQRAVNPLPEELEEENRQLREIVSPTSYLFPIGWRLTEGQRRVLAAFVARSDGYLSNADVVAVAVRFSDRSSPHYASTIICNMHRKLKPIGIECANRHGYGYQLTPSSRELIRKALLALKIVEGVKERLC